MQLTRRSWLRTAAALPLAGAIAGPGGLRPARAAGEPIKIGVLHSLSGTMAISETILKDLMLMQVADLNAQGGLLGRPIQPVVVDPASNWPLFAEKARELLTADKVAAVFGCWTSVSRKSVLPVFEELNGLLYYPLEYEGEEQSKNVFYGSSVPDNKAVPALKYLMSAEGGSVKRFVLEGTDYVYPRTSNAIMRGFLKSVGVADVDIQENYTPFGFSDWQNEVARIKKFGSAGKKTAVVSTINGDANVPFYKELGNQGIKATDIPVIAFSVGEEELAGIDTRPLVGHLAGWSYFESLDNPENAKFIKRWHDYTKDPKRVTNDPMESEYVLFHMWAQAVTKAGTTNVDAVREAMIGQQVNSPSGFRVTMGANHHMAKPLMIGEIQADGQFDVVYHTAPIQPNPWSPYIATNKAKTL
jgi:branched-chain amino acid transport system substrate-binding protein/urea transport system substrate-binding protein